MSEIWGLLAVLAALYGWECTHWAAGNSLVVSRTSTGGRIVPAKRLLGDIRPALFLPDPWPWTEVFAAGCANAGASSFDFAEALATSDRARGAARGLKIATSALGLAVFGFGPLLVLALGLERSWRPWIASVLIASIAVIGLFHRRYRALCPEANDRLQVELVMLFLPLAAMRAVATLTLRTMAGFHPLVVAMALCPPEHWRPLVRQALLDQSRSGRTTPDLEWLLETTGTTANDLLAPPTHREPTALSYCPRCHAQYRLATGSCRECGEIALALFSGSVPAAPDSRFP